MEVPMNPIFACSGCHKKFYADGFKINRLGLRHKTCLECSARALAKQARIQTGEVDKEHGKLCNRDPERIDTEARKYDTRLVDPSSYTNARTKVEWECLTCQHRFITQWQFIHTQFNTCQGYFHKVSHLRPYWLELAQERGLNEKVPQNYPEDFQECVRRYESSPQQ